MKKHITDTKTGISYTLQGDYYLPDLSLPAEEEIPIGVWGQRHAAFLKNNQCSVYNEFLVSGKLQQNLAQIDRDAQDMFDLLIRQLAKQEGITETLKAENQMEWVQRMHSIRNRARCNIIVFTKIQSLRFDRTGTSCRGRPGLLLLKCEG